MLDPKLIEAFLLRHKHQIASLSMSEQGVLLRCLQASTTDGWGKCRSTLLGQASLQWSQEDIRHALRAMAERNLIKIYPLTNDTAKELGSRSWLDPSRAAAPQLHEIIPEEAWAPRKTKSKPTALFPRLFVWRLNIN